MCISKLLKGVLHCLWWRKKKVIKLKLAENCRYSNWLCILPEHVPTTLRATSPFCFCEGDFHYFRLFSIGLVYLLCLCCFFERKKNVFLLIYDVKLIFLFCLRDHFECGGYSPPRIRFCFPKSASCRACAERDEYASRSRCFPNHNTEACVEHLCITLETYWIDSITLQAGRPRHGGDCTVFTMTLPKCRRLRFVTFCIFIGRRENYLHDAGK